MPHLSPMKVQEGGHLVVRWTMFVWIISVRFQFLDEAGKDPHRKNEADSVVQL